MINHGDCTVGIHHEKIKDKIFVPILSVYISEVA